MDELTIVIVSYHSHNHIRENLIGLLEQGRFRTIIVDNAATPESAKALRELPGKAEILAPGINLGYGRAANIGLRRASTPYLMLLNPDLTTSVEDIDKMLAIARNDKWGSIIWAPATQPENHDPMASVRKVSWVSGAAMLLDRQAISEIGGFDENIFLFSEDTDLCERTLHLGHTITLCPSVLFYHAVGKSSPPDPKTEYLKWWHFGWSQCYRLVKNGHCTLFTNPRRKYITYRIHSLTATSKSKRMKWKAKADGSLAYIRGVKAFRKDGTPQFS